MPHNRGDLVVSFALAAPSVTLGEPVFVEFSISNRSAERIECDLGHDRKEHLAFVVTQPDGTVVHPAALNAEGIGRLGTFTVDPGQTCAQRLLLNEWHQFSEPGSYEIEPTLTVSLHTQSGAEIPVGSSERLLLEVLSRDPARLNAVCRALVDTVLNAGDVETVVEAASTLSHVRDPIAVPHLHRVLQEPVARGARLAAISGLGRIASDEAMALLNEIARGEDPDEAALAVFTLHQLRDPDDV